MAGDVGSSSSCVAVIGLGRMGSAVASRLIEDGWLVQGYDTAGDARSSLSEIGGHACGSPSEAVRGASVVIVLVHAEDQADLVFRGSAGILSEIEPGTVIWLATTVSPTFVHRLESDIADRGAHLIDGPVSGGPDGARSGTLTVFLAHSEAAATDVFARVLSCCTQQAFRFAAVGEASLAKLLNQVLTASHIALTAEVLAAARLAGIDADTLIDAIEQSAGASKQFTLRARRMVTHDALITATGATFLKDLRLALHETGNLGLDAPMTAAAVNVFGKAEALGLGSNSDTMIFDAYLMSRAEI